MQVQKKRFIFNISTTRVVGAVTYFDEKKQVPIVDYLKEENIDLKKSFSLKDFREETLRAINKVCIDFISEKKTTNDEYFVEQAEVFLMAPWVNYENYSLNDEAMSPFVMNDEYLNHFLLKKNNYEDKIILNSEVSSVKANDYDVDLMDLKDKSIQKIKLSFLDSFLLKFDKYFIDGAIRNHFSLIKIRFNSFLPVLFGQVQKIYDPRDDFTFLDISSEITEFGIFKNGEIKDIITIPFGINKILNKIIDDNKLEFYEAESLLKMYLSGDLEDFDSKKIKKIIESEVKKIKDEINKISDRLPLNTFLVSSKWETNKIIKEAKIFNNLYFINKNLIDDYVYFQNESDWDNFIALEVEYSYS